MTTPTSSWAGSPGSRRNVPNVLTTIRIILVPVFGWMLLSHPHEQGWRITTTLVFMVAIATDFVDGRIARKYGLVTNFGKLWDPIADKAITGMAFIGLSILGELQWWVTIVILVREWGITLLRWAIMKYGVMAANRGGKLKTAMQSLALTLYLLWLPHLPAPVRWLAWACMAIAFALTVLTGLDYLREAAKLRREALARWAAEGASGTAGGMSGASRLVAEFGRWGWTLATCESLTAGAVAGEIATVPGASTVLRGGLITYATDLKTALAGVEAAIIERDSVISQAVVEQMARGARDRCAATVGVACTGVAGPDPQDGHQPGEVWIAVAGPGGVLSRHLQMSGDRASIRRATVAEVIGLALKLVG